MIRCPWTTGAWAAALLSCATPAAGQLTGCPPPTWRLDWYPALDFSASFSQKGEAPLSWRLDGQVGADIGLGSVGDEIRLGGLVGMGFTRDNRAVADTTIYAAVDPVTLVPLTPLQLVTEVDVREVVESSTPTWIGGRLTWVFLRAVDGGAFVSAEYLSGLRAGPDGVLAALGVEVEHVRLALFASMRGRRAGLRPSRYHGGLRVSLGLSSFVRPTPPQPVRPPLRSLRGSGVNPVMIERATTHTIETVCAEETRFGAVSRVVEDHDELRYPEDLFARLEGASLDDLSASLRPLAPVSDDRAERRRTAEELVTGLWRGLRAVGDYGGPPPVPGLIGASVGTPVELVPLEGVVGIGVTRDAAMSDASATFSDPKVGWARRAQRWRLEGMAGQSVTIVVTSDDFDTYVYLQGPDLALEDDDGIVGTTNSRLVATLPEDGVYEILVATYGDAETGRYTLVVR